MDPLRRGHEVEMSVEQRQSRTRPKAGLHCRQQGWEWGVLSSREEFEDEVECLVLTRGINKRKDEDSVCAELVDARYPSRL
jgi:hypothetical protein